MGKPSPAVHMIEKVDKVSWHSLPFRLSLGDRTMCGQRGQSHSSASPPLIAWVLRDRFILQMVQDIAQTSTSYEKKS